MADASARPARAEDAPALGELQARAWSAAYAGLLPAEVLQGLEPQALAQSWREALEAPPDRRHVVLLALAGNAPVGFAAVGPAEDPDLDPAVDADLGLLLVDPDARGRGHGSRLLAAAVDTLQELGFARAHAWVPAADGVFLAFLTGTGWAADGARRTLDLRGDGAVVVEQVRLHTALSEGSEPADR